MNNRVNPKCMPKVRMGFDVKSNFLLEMRLLFLSACFDIISKWIMVKNIKMYADTLLRVLL